VENRALTQAVTLALWSLSAFIGVHRRLVMLWKAGENNQEQCQPPMNADERR
jgi:hypothetical protein